ncbi:MAG: metalloregulator ArsR/SmtB family transcription factor [Trueperaceae bacterium]|nr:MAG: metalloregulator ArsR/SmtB family transcription factor [Trueperaceae bacterium]
MTQEQLTQTLLRFFKALADANRLKIVGLLAQRPHTVEELAASLELSSSTVSHHLRKLADVDLVEARAESYYSIYSLRTEVLTRHAQSLLGQEELPRLATGADLDAFDKKVLQTFTDADGRITAFPAQQKKYLVLLRHVLGVFETEVRYTEKQVNELLLRFNDDTARLRRSLVDHGFMAREGGGGDYWRVV